MMTDLRLLRVLLAHSAFVFALQASDVGASPPTLLLDLDALGESFAAGDLFARAGDAWLFWVDERHESGTPLEPFDDKVRLILWRTDGTTEGTYPLSPPNRSLYDYAGSLGGIAFVILCKADEPIDAFEAAVHLCDHPFDLELWRTDGTTEGTFRLSQMDRRDLFPGRVAVTVPELDLLFFLTRDEEDLGYELWASDGSFEGTRVVENLSNRGLHFVRELTRFQSEVYFLGFTRDGSVRTWIGRTDGTAEGTRISGGPNRGKLRGATILPGVDRLFVVGVRSSEPDKPGSSQRRSLWTLRPNQRTFRRLGELGTRGAVLQSFAATGRTFFRVSEHGLTDLWSTDGTSPLVQLGAKMPTSGGSGYVWAEPWELSGGRAFVNLFDPERWHEPWISDGTVAGTERLKDLCHKDCSSFPAGVGIVEDSHFFSAVSQNWGRELWRWRPEIDGPGTVELVADLCRGACSSSPLLRERIGDHLVVLARDRSGARRLWILGPGGVDPQRVTDAADFAIGAHDYTFRYTIEEDVRRIGDRLIFWAWGPRGQPALWSWPIPEPLTSQDEEP